MLTLLQWYRLWYGTHYHIYIYIVLCCVRYLSSGETGVFQYSETNHLKPATYDYYWIDLSGGLPWDYYTTTDPQVFTDAGYTLNPTSSRDYGFRVTIGPGLLSPIYGRNKKDIYLIVCPSVRVRQYVSQSMLRWVLEWVTDGGMVCIDVPTYRL